MERNVGDTEKTVRMVLGVAFGVVAMAVVAWGGSLGAATQVAVVAVALVLAVAMLATASAETCPINAAVGRDSYRGRE